MSEPQKLDPAAAVKRIERIAAAVSSRTIPDPLEPADLEGTDLAADIAAGIDDKREATWSRVMPSRFISANLEQFDQGDEARAMLDEWAHRPRGRNLVLFGAVGVGKSHTAVAACRQAHWRGLEVKFLPIVELLDLLRPGGPERALYDLAEVDRLIIDDVGSERATDWTAERLFALVNRRWLEELPTVATSNLEPEQLRDEVGERTYSRLVGNDAVTLELLGPDRRRQR